MNEFYKSPSICGNYSLLYGTIPRLCYITDSKLIIILRHKYERFAIVDKIPLAKTILIRYIVSK